MLLPALQKTVSLTGEHAADASKGMRDFCLPGEEAYPLLVFILGKRTQFTSLSLHLLYEVRSSIFVDIACDGWTDQ